MSSCDPSKPLNYPYLSCRDSKVVQLNINQRAYNAIKNGTKTVEVRANKPGSQLLGLSSGDVIIFASLDSLGNHSISGDTIKVIVTRVTLYKTVRELLLSEGIKQTLSSGKDIEGGIESIHSIPGYKQLIEENGVLAIVFF